MVVDDTRRRFYAVARLDPARLSRDAGRIAQEIVAHLEGLVGTQVEVTLEINATNGDGFPERVRKIVEKNASSLRVRDAKFERS